MKEKNGYVKQLPCVLLLFLVLPLFLLLPLVPIPTQLPKRKPGRNLWLNSLLLMLNP